MTPPAIVLARMFAALVMMLAAAGPAAASTIIDYITFDGVDYLRWQEDPTQTDTAVGAERLA